MTIVQFLLVLLVASTPTRYGSAFKVERVSYTVHYELVFEEIGTISGRKTCQFDSECMFIGTNERLSALWIERTHLGARLRIRCSPDCSLSSGESTQSFSSNERNFYIYDGADPRNSALYTRRFVMGHLSLSLER